VAINIRRGDKARSTSTPQPRPRRALPRAFARVGPEVLTAASDNDPTNVGTAALVGAQTQYQLSWVAVLVAPLLGVVLAIAAQVGTVARSDLQSLVMKRYGRGMAMTLLVSVVLVNLVTIAADLQAGAAGIGLLAGIGAKWVVLPLGLALVALLLIGKYDEVVTILRYLLLGFLAFGVAAILAHPRWPQVLKGTFVPTLSLRPEELTGALALLGTTMTTYVYLWETIARGVEEPPDSSPDGKGLARARLGAVIGAVSTAVILWFMLITSGATLGLHHEAVTSAQGAALSLRPLAGGLADDLFAAGLITSAVVALPVLMASTAYAIGTQFNWRRGLSQGIHHARVFYVVLAASMGLAVAVDVAGVSLLDMLVAASVIGGLATPLGIALLVRLGRDPQVMGDRRIPAWLAVAGWAIVVVIGGLGLLYVGWGLLT
jgi:NRAMP (natural resistance-associated macrophage protein)-like metal ion transporter